MYCNACGRQIQDDANLCAYCGRRVGYAVPQRRLVRPIDGRKLGGVALGMAQYFNEDVTLVRIIWVLAFFLLIPLAVIAYIVMWIVVPEEPLRLPATTTSVTSASPQG